MSVLACPQSASPRGPGTWVLYSYRFVPGYLYHSGDQPIKAWVIVPCTSAEAASTLNINIKVNMVSTLPMTLARTAARTKMIATVVQRRVAPIARGILSSSRRPVVPSVTVPVPVPELVRHVSGYGYRYFADVASDSTIVITKDNESTLSSPKLDALYGEITKLSEEDVNILGALVIQVLGRKIFPGEFGGRGLEGLPVNFEGEQGTEEEVEVKTKFGVKLVGYDASAKIKVIKEVRAIAALGLKEAKDLVESIPKFIVKDLSSDKAEELKAQLEAVGAQIEID